ncbi:Uncharacterized protein dnm_061250 [Desulfonema magnum]|uniref:Uncharacterized protein n=1 Tax=Desulfonema magnum TaxID=45655 RepID=A0A975BQL9_9BACT|nr:Uncharacterized protein dnm_061250 [Desulfonema magnum]
MNIDKKPDIMRCLVLSTCPCDTTLLLINMASFTKAEK